MDTGPEKVRRRYTVVPRSIDIPMLFTGSQRGSFNTFWNNCWGQSGIAAGTFEWDDPLSGSTVTYRWRSAAKPRFTAKFQGTSTLNARWETVLQLEILPSA